MSMLHQTEETLIKFLYYTNEIYFKPTWLEKKHNFKGGVLFILIFTVKVWTINNPLTFDPNLQ